MRKDAADFAKDKYFNGYSDNRSVQENFDLITLFIQEQIRDPSETDSIKSQIPSKTSSGKKDSTKDAIKDTTSDSQVNSCFPYRWPPASLTLNIYFYLFLYQYTTSITINNGTPHLKPPKNQNRRAALGRPAIKLLGGFN